MIHAIVSTHHMTVSQDDDNKGVKIGSQNKESSYQVLSPRRHCLHRPDMCIGSIEIEERPVTVCTDGQKKGLELRVLSFNPGIVKIFDEIVTNAADCAQRDPKCNKIEVTVDQANGEVTVQNNGTGIPIKKQEVEINGERREMYIPHIIFGELNSGSNFDDTESRVVAGRNGLGAKLTNIFSREFEVEVADPARESKFQMKWFNNMYNHSEPKVTRYKNKVGYTRIRFVPDLARFHIESTSSEEWVNCCRMFERRVCDISITTPATTRVRWNGEECSICTFKDYASALCCHDSSVLCCKTDSTDRPWDIAVAPRSREGASVMSFVNGVETIDGGTHLEYIRNRLADLVAEACRGKRGGSHLVTPKHIKDSITIVLSATVENPTFSTQSKTRLTTPSSKFKTCAVIPSSFVTKIANGEIGGRAIVMAMESEKMTLASKDAKANRKKPRGIPNLDDANKAGTAKSEQCTLILTEGLSAKALVVAGISEIGRDLFGIFPLKGKLLNTRGASLKQIGANSEICNIKQIMGLESGKRYTSLSELRYGRVCIAADADVDGAHIKGLVLNFFHSQWPELVSLGLVCSLVTPIVRVRRIVGGGAEKGPLSFFSLSDFEAWQRELPEQEKSKWVIKYYKGLGTSTAAEAKEIFRGYKQNVVDLVDPPDSEQEEGPVQTMRVMDMAFQKMGADKRREWMLRSLRAQSLACTEAERTTAATGASRATGRMSIPDFVENELVTFSLADIHRSIPHIMDGLKPAQRKVIFTCIRRGFYDKRGDGQGIKVAQIGGAVSEHAAYHHGEASLHATIVGLAQDYIGSNQLPLLHGIGQFGTRLAGGKDAASARYITTYLSEKARRMFSQEDDVILDHVEDDGQIVEPTHYVPSLPLILINGSIGIGSGWSTEIPPYDIGDILENTQRIARGEKELKEMHPGFKGFRGSVSRVSEHKWKFSGTFEWAGKFLIRITELPPGTWTNSYVEWLNDQSWVKSIRNNSTQDTVDITIKVVDGSVKGDDEAVIEKLHLTRTSTTSNMHAFDSSGCIRKYASAEDILREWSVCRLNWYEKRRLRNIDRLTNDACALENRIRFVQCVIDGALSLPRPRRDLDTYLDDNGFTRVDGGFSYLFDMSMSSVTRESLDKLKEKLDRTNEQHRAFVNSTAHTIMSEELDSMVGMLK